MSQDRLNTKAAGIVGGAVMLSRILGLARELIFAGLFGAGLGMDAFLTAEFLTCFGISSRKGLFPQLL